MLKHRWLAAYFAISAILRCSPSLMSRLEAQTTPELERVSSQENSASSKPQAPIAVISVTTREVVVDVVATDHHDHPLLDLRPSDFEVFEIGEGGHRIAQRVTHAQVVRPSLNVDATEPQSSYGLHVALGGGCAERSTAHYQIAYQVNADQLQSGSHQVEIVSSRHDVKLAYTPRYFVGATGVDPMHASNSSPRGEAAEIASLEEAACYHTGTPLSIPLTAYLIHSGLKDATVYEVAASRGSLPLLSLSADARRLSLAFAACTFDSDGRALKVFHTATDRTLTLREYAQASLLGLPSRINFPEDRAAAFVRFVVVNRLNGNLGSVLVATPAPVRKYKLTPAEAEQEIEWIHEGLRQFGVRRDVFPPMGPKGSFGTVEPRPEALCGDVYELPTDTPLLPNYWNLASVGSVYADVLDVPHQQFWATGGVPGVTRKTDWFGIDYHGAFWVSVPGKFQFKLVADDGAKLYIDDALIIDADGEHNLVERDGTVQLAIGPHAIHLPYFQGAQRSVALQLFVAAPGKELQPFDVRDYAPPSASSQASQ